MKLQSPLTSGLFVRDSDQGISTEIEFLLSESFTELDLNAQAGSAEFFDNSLKLNFLDSGLSNLFR